MSDRNLLIRLAAILPVGDESRRSLLSRIASGLTPENLKEIQRVNSNNPAELDLFADTYIKFKPDVMLSLLDKRPGYSKVVMSLVTFAMAKSAFLKARTDSEKKKAASRMETCCSQLPADIRRLVSIPE
jgi:hypothetical protein